MNRCFSILPLLFLAAGFLFSPLLPGKERIPVLCLASLDTASQGLDGLDPVAVEAYAQEGFDLDFGYYQEVTREKLRQYPLVVGMIPQLHAGTQAITPELGEWLDEYLREGGGLILLPGPSYYAIDDFPRQLNPFLERYGVRVCNDIPMDRRPENTLVQVRGLAYRYLKTTALHRSHPVTREIPFLYLPLDFSYAYVRTYTMSQPSSEWTILVTGEESCGSYLRASMATGMPQEGLWRERPPFLALREVGKGTLALFTTASRYFFYDAFHWAFGEGFVLREGHGLALMANLLRYAARNAPPPTIPQKTPPLSPRTRGNVSVSQDLRQWYRQVMEERVPEGFGVKGYVQVGGVTDVLYRRKVGQGRLPEPSRNWLVRRPWMDIFHPTAASGRGADEGGFRYRFDDLQGDRRCLVGLLVWSTQPEGARDLVVSWVDADGTSHLLGELPLPRLDQKEGPFFQLWELPPEALEQGYALLDFRRSEGGTGEFTLLSELWLFQEGAPSLTPDQLVAQYGNPAFGMELLPEERQWHRGVVCLAPEGQEKSLQEAAEGMGMDFLILLQRGTESESFARLSQACHSFSRGGFQAIPGFLWEREESPGTPGERAWFAGPIQRMPTREEQRNPRELFWKFFGGELAGGSRVVGNLLPNPHNEMAPWHLRFWRGWDLSENPKRAQEQFLRLTAEGYAPQPRGMATWKTPGKWEGWHLEIPTPPGEKPWDFSYASCASSGPRFQQVSFSSDLTRDGEPGNGEVFREGLWTVASLKASYTHPIVQATLYGGGRILRRFYPHSAQVEWHEPVRVDRQMALYWVLEGEDGTWAATGSYSFTDERMRGLMCADNQNSICSVSQAPSAFVRDERELYLQHSYWHTGEAQGQLGIMQDARNLVPRVIETGIIQVCKAFQPMPVLQRKEGTQEDHMAAAMSIVSASGEANHIRYRFQEPEGILASQVDLTAFRPSPKGETTVRVELELRAQKALAAEEVVSLRLMSLGLMPSLPARWKYVVETPSGRETGELSSLSLPLSLPLAPRGGVALFPSDLAVPLLFSLQEERLDLRLDVTNAWNCRERVGVYLPPVSWEKGQVRRFSFLVQLSQKAFSGPEELSVRKEEVLGRGKKAFGGALQGSLLEEAEGLDFQAEEGAVVWRCLDRGSEDPLPLRIRGLNPHGSALALWKGDEWHPLPVDDEGVGYFALPAGVSGEVILGNPILCDNPDIRLEFAGVSSRGVSFRVHNPLPVAKLVRLRSHPAFSQTENFPEFDCLLRVNSGAGMWITAQGKTLQVDATR
ncbi:MAG: hypothetical protein ACI4SG_00545 [Oligosphaeraceae bacterium]